MTATKKTEIPEKSENVIKAFLFKHKYYVVLITALIVIFAWSKIKINSLEKSYRKETTQLVENYTLQMDSIKLASIEQTIKVFTWAIRSEMLRDNLEQVNQFFLAFVKEKNVNRIELIDSETNQILLSTDKKNEGEIFQNTDAIAIEKYTMDYDSVSVRIFSPVMGLDKKIAILFVEMKN